MSVLVTGFNGKVGKEVARKLKGQNLSFTCGVRSVEKAVKRFGEEFSFVELDFSNPETFAAALEGIEQVFLIYPPGDKMEFGEFLKVLKEMGVQHIVYLSVKDVQYLPFIHHFKNEKLIKKLGVPYTFIRAGYFMQNLQDFLGQEIKENKRIFVPAGKGKASFVDTRDLAEVALQAFLNPEKFRYTYPVITGEKALDFYEVAEIMTAVLGEKIVYTNPSVKEFKSYMVNKGEKEDFVNVVVGIHFPTKLGLTKGVTADFEKITNSKPIPLEQYVKDYQEKWLTDEND
ncbi:SDR family oxidoreductase [Halobacillus sp. GSS1]|uniref:SDR family oxidoreductase n=1 Tax=Halobacillus sp. GSS1 TaxID=2815919 RepID=UPI001A907745|nr:SDR family oxidoreductase [Halobacillus sp. GSS1]MBN9654214.1 SDR family oxidoreductase [Halobacillus sp. GSS1]